MSDKEEAAHTAVIERWRRKQALNEDTGEAAVRGFKAILKEGLKSSRSNLAREMKGKIEGEVTHPFGNMEGGFSKDFEKYDNDLNADGIPTGKSPRRWERDFEE